jgi:hypothetical protein
MVTWQCGYCGFIWFQPSGMKPGFEAVPAGWWENFRWPEGFHGVPSNYPIREQNTREYWDAYSEKLRRRRERRR